MNIIRRFYIDIRYYCYKIIYPFPKIASLTETLAMLKTSNKSIARFGDGEFHMIDLGEDLGFQQRNDKLSVRLKEILLKRDETCLIGLPEGLRSIRGFEGEGHFFWKQFVVFHYKKYKDLFRQNDTYYNANITRPYMDYRNKAEVGQVFDLLKEIWADKKLLIVEGTMSRLGVGNDLFRGATSVHRILTLPKNAFDVYDALFPEIIRHSPNYDLVLLALGPTATVMAYDLARSGIRSLDIGHIDIEYEWFLKKATYKVAIDGKHVNEVVCSSPASVVRDEHYEAQVISRIFTL